jgi:hypothetical protein
MYEFNLWVLVLLAFALWFAFQWGVFYGRARQRRIDELYRRAKEAQDPEEKQRLLLEWNELDDSPLKKAFREALLIGKRNKH